MISSRRDFLKGIASGALISAVAPNRAFSIGAVSTADVIFIKRGEGDYQNYRQPFNKRITLQPAVIAVCKNERGVVEAVRYAATNKLPIAIKSGGHCFEGYSLNEGGLMIELSAMNDLSLRGEQLKAGPGCKLAQLYDYMLPRGRLIPTGSCGGVGLAGLTCDSLNRVRMIDGQGKIRDSRDEPELLWACRGGGNGNFGVITHFEFDTHPAPELFHAYRFKYANLTPKKIAELVERWFAVTPGLPAESFSAFVASGKTVTILVTSFASAQDHPAQVLNEFRRDATNALPVQRDVLQKSLKRYYGRKDPLYFKNVSAGFYRNFSDIKSIAEEMFQLVADHPGMLFQINTFGGKSVIHEAAYSAFPYRDYVFIGELQFYWDSPSQESKAVTAVKSFQRLLWQYGVHAHYCNYPDIDLENWMEAYYGKNNYQQLQAIKKIYDPEDRIRHPQSVRLPPS